MYYSQELWMFYPRIAYRLSRELGYDERLTFRESGAPWRIGEFPPLGTPRVEMPRISQMRAISQ